MDNEVKTEPTETTEPVGITVLRDAIEAIRKNRMLQMAFRQRKNFNLKFRKTGEVEAKAKGGKGTQKVPVYEQVFWPQGKYTGEKLRELRKQETLKAIEGKTHWNDGTPIIHDRLIDLNAA